MIALKRSRVLRIGETSNVRDVIFSATSSWLYVNAAASAGTGYLIVETRDGRRWRLNRPTVSDAAITDRGKVMPKAEVRSVFYVRYKPFSDREEYFWRESGSFGYVFMPVVRSCSRNSQSGYTTLIHKKTLQKRSVQHPERLRPLTSAMWAYWTATSAGGR